MVDQRGEGEIRVWGEGVCLGYIGQFKLGHFFVVSPKPVNRSGYEFFPNPYIEPDPISLRTPKQAGPDQIGSGQFCD